MPHITLKSIANNPDIDTIYDEDHPKIAAALADLNTALVATPPKPLKPAQGVRKGKPVDFAKGDTLFEWEVPFDLPEDWPDAARAPFDAFDTARQAMQRRLGQFHRPATAIHHPRPVSGLHRVGPFPRRTESVHGPSRGTPPRPYQDSACLPAKGQGRSPSYTLP